MGLTDEAHAWFHGHPTCPPDRFVSIGTGEGRQPGLFVGSHRALADWNLHHLAGGLGLGLGFRLEQFFERRSGDLRVRVRIRSIISKKTGLHLDFGESCPLGMESGSIEFWLDVRFVRARYMTQESQG